jgi:hypothetical protein
MIYKITADGVAQWPEVSEWTLTFLYGLLSRCLIGYFD